MKKKLISPLIFLLILSLCITAISCSSTNSLQENENNEEKVEDNRPDYIFTDLKFSGKNCNVPDTIISPEKYTFVNESLRITQEQKDAFIKKYSKEEYDGAVSTLSSILHIQNNLKVGPSYTSELKETHTINDVVLTSKLDGHHITADHILQKNDKNNDTIILVHGINGNRRSMKEEVLFYLNLGYNVFTYDQRSSGENDGFFYTLGIWEQYDLLDCINYIDNEISNDKKIVVLDQSSGGTSTSLLLANEDVQDKVDAVILDSPVTSIYDLIKSQLINHVDIDQMDDVMQCSENLMKFMYGFGFEDGEVTNFVADTKIPVLLFTSEVDEIVPKKHSQRLFDAIKEEDKKIIISKSSRHCAMKNTEHDVYEKEVRDFLGL